MYASTIELYDVMMFPKIDFLPDGQAVRKREWTMTEIDSLDVHFFTELMNHNSEGPKEEGRYLSEVW